MCYHLSGKILKQVQDDNMIVILRLQPSRHRHSEGVKRLKNLFVIDSSVTAFPQNDGKRRLGIADFGGHKAAHANENHAFRERQ